MSSVSEKTVSKSFWKNLLDFPLTPTGVGMLGTFGMIGGIIAAIALRCLIETPALMLVVLAAGLALTARANVVHKRGGTITWHAVIIFAISVIVTVASMLLVLSTK